MKVTISSDDKLDHVIAVVQALYGVRLQQVRDDGTSTSDASQFGLPEEQTQGATKPRHG
jgi:hypothetical protein